MTRAARHVGAEDNARPLVWAMAWIGACLVLGGASNAGLLANAALQLGAVAIIAAAIWKGGRDRAGREAAFPAFVLAILVGWIGLTLIPLPPGLWVSLPGRQFVAEGYRLLGMELPWLPVSLTDDRTIRSALALLVPVATYLLVKPLTSQQQRKLAFGVGGFAVLSVMLGMVQLLGGQDSPLRLYRITNRTDPVGLFANANHLATLLLITIPLVLSITPSTETRRRKPAKPKFAWSGTVSLAMAAIAVIGLALIASKAGLLLAVPALAGGWLIRVMRGSTIRTGVAVGLAGVVLTAAALAVAALASGKFTDQLGSSASSRSDVSANTISAAIENFPTGTGLGSFAQVYLIKTGGQGSAREWMNHAHNDAAEVFLELGLPGIVVMALSVVWLLAATIRLWRGAPGGEGRDLARASCLGIGLVMVHSLADYPLRTAAIAALLGMAVAIVVAARRADRTIAPQP